MYAEDLFDLSHSRAGSFLKTEESVWQAFPKISQYLQEICKVLPDDYQEIKPGVWVGPNTYIESTALIQGPAIIGANCEIRHSAFIRANVICGDGVVIGNATEVKNAVLFDEVRVPHFNYIGDSILGYQVHLGAGAIISNFKATGSQIHVFLGGEKIGSGLQKFGALLGDRVEIGCNSVLYPGTIIGRDSIIYPLSSTRGTFAANTILKSDGKVYLKR